VGSFATSVGPRERVFAPIAGPHTPLFASPRCPVRKPLQLAPYREELDTIREESGEIVARYEGRLEGLNETLQAELAPLRQRMGTVRQALQAEMAHFQVTLPERSTPEIDPVDEDDWLFSSERDYLTQLAMYKARKNGQAEGTA
jgi:hypothetical protein